MVGKEKHEEISTTDFLVIDESKYKLCYMGKPTTSFSSFSLSILLLVWSLDTFWLNSVELDLMK